MNKKGKYIVISIITVMMIVLIGYGLVAFAETTTFGANVLEDPTEAGLGVIQKKIIKKYEYRAPSYQKITTFPINRAVFDSSADFFCAQHGTPYANSGRPTVLGKSSDDYHDPHTITKHKVSAGSSTSDPKGDIDTSADVYLDENGNTVWNLKEPYNGHRERDTETNPVNTVYTNWVYIPHDLQFDCEEPPEGKPDASTVIRTKNGGSPIEDGGMAFILACYRGRTTSYASDPRQHAVWDWLGQLSSSGYRSAALAFQLYHKDSEEPDVDTKPADNVGTTISGSTYTVGPFDMSNYVRAEDYSYDVGGKISIKDGDEDDLADTDIDVGEEKDVNLQKIINTAATNGSGSDSDLRGTIIKAEAVVTNEAGDIKRIEFPVPDPNKPYNINFAESDIQGYDEILDIIFTYQRVHSCGAGTWYDGQQKAITFNGYSSTKKSSCTYNCTEHTPSYATHETGKSDGGLQTCTYKWTCDDHDEGCGCKGNHHDHTCSYDEDGNRTCSGSTRAGCHCACKGHSDTHTSIFKCPTHSHEHCHEFNWNKPTDGGDYAQDGFAGSGLLVTEKIEYKVRVHVPMKTQMSIYKYITKVDHVGEDINLWDLGEDRREMTMDEKYNDPVPVERGDLVTYKIELVNDSRFPTRVKVKDLLPENCEPLYVNLVDCTLEEMPDCIKLGKEIWITVEGHDKNVYEVKVRPIKDSGKYTNIIEFITKNDTAEHMQYDTWGDNATHGPHKYGNLVNTRKDGDRDVTTDLKEKDSDTYVIKEYNVSIEKFIYDVKHNEDVDLGSVADGLDTSVIHNSEERNRKTLGADAENIKEKNPVYVEYGDIVTYKIIVYNTTDNTGTDFDIPSRDNEPYWQPDKVYVNLKDTLPKKYSELDVKVEDAPAPILSTSSAAGASEHSISIGATESESGGEFTITDLMVPAGQTRTVTVTLKVEEYEKGTIEENNVKFDPEEIRNINKGPSGRADDKFCVIKNHSTNLETSDWYILNNYNTFTDKYVYKYDEKMQHQNETERYSQGGYVTNGDGSSPAELIKSRRNEAPGTSTVTDKHGMIDEVKVVDAKENDKKEFPVSVEKTETIVYRIAVTNEAKEATTVNTIDSGRKPATQVRTSTVTDHMEIGLTFKGVTAAIYSDANGENKVKDVTSVAANLVQADKEKDGRHYNVYEFTVGNETIVNPGQTIIYEVTVLIDQSNMYLFDLENNATLTKLTNINNTDSEEREVKNDKYNEDISPQDKEGSSDFVRMKDLVIGGWVWVDFDKNGLKDDKVRDESDKAYFNLDDNAMKRDVVVKLYRANGENGELIRTTKTDSTGFYTFGKGSDNAFGWRTNDYNYAEGLPTSDTYKLGQNLNIDYYQRVEKATNKDANGNYQANSVPFNYYIEFEYDGVVFKSTEFYSGMDNLEKDPTVNNYGEAKDPYKTPGDSNALEFTDIREEFNKKYEYITYDKAYDVNKTNGVSLAFDKTNHTSQLIEDPSRTITARSFIKADTIQGKYDSSHKDWNPAPCTSSISNTNLLWLFSFDSSKDNNETPETEYLKDINLGLELREDVDINLSKDVYSVKTTINGEQMEYFYNKNNSVNGEMSSAEGDEDNKLYLNDFIIKTPYGLDLYESDYKMRVEQYKANAVKAYKGINGESELNVEVTYRITVANKSINDDETLPKDKMKDTKLKAKISEIVDLYDSNFMKYNSPDDKIDIKLANAQGYLEDATIKVAEAWYFKQDDSGDYIIGDGVFSKTYADDSGNVYKKPVFVKADSTAIGSETRYKKVDLTLKNTSMLGEGGNSEKENSNNFTADGYNTIYITGMENDPDLDIAEGENIDIYVKYVLDKDNLEVKNENSDYSDTQTSSTDTFVGADGSVLTTISTAYESTFTLHRSLKLKDHVVEKDVKTERGLENIAQVNLYSIWYEDGKPASIVDMDSNAGNIGNTEDKLVDKLKDDVDSASRKSKVGQAKKEKAGKYTSADNWDPYYEDTTYKTGIELTADGTEWTKEEASTKHPNLKIQKYKMLRELSGMVWDDARTESDAADSLNSQYSGDGIFDGDKEKPKEKQEKALDNVNVPTNYINEFTKNVEDKTKEKFDFNVRNAKVELIEIVEIPSSVTGTGKSHYYEEILGNVTWQQAQHIRTNGEGLYTVNGFIPGRYIVRFTYGDTIKDLTNAEVTYAETSGTPRENAVDYARTDMQIFNGQDYKTTKYAYNLDEYVADDSEGVAKIASTESTIDKYAARHNSETGAISDNDVVMTALERPDLSDARDDEIRRLDVNNYSEIMINEKAEVLKGLANSTGLAETRLDGDAEDKGLSINYYKYFEDDEYQSQKEEYLDELTNKTYMEAETVEFLVKPEKLDYEQTTTQSYYVKLSGGKDYYYNDLDTIVNNIITERRYKIENIDMGIEYRPETNISLTKEIDTIQLVTSDNEVLVDLKMKTREENGRVIHYIDTENSKGAENVQIVSNTYDIDPLLEGIIDVYEEQRQGFIYVAVDEDILQGCRVVLTYKFLAENNSEVDRISNRLNNIRFYANSETNALKSTYATVGALNSILAADTTGAEVEGTEYTANNFARNIVKFDVYEEDAQNITYRNRPKTMILDEINNINDGDGTNGYFGKYVGYTYYIGEDPNNLDTISELKFDVVIDYVDTDLEFEQVSQSNGVKFTEVGSAGSGDDSDLEGALNTGKDIVNQFGVANQNWSNRSTLPATNLSRYLFKLNSPWGAINQALKAIETTPPETTPGDPTNPIKKVEQIAADMLTDIQGIKYKSLVMTVSDKVSDSDENNNNNLFSKYLQPSVVNEEKSVATVYLPVSKLLATETDTDNMLYENIAEVSQFTVLTGRRTNFDTTIGNVDIHEVLKQNEEKTPEDDPYDKFGSIEYVTAALETDTSSTETITLTPPTGLMKNRRVIFEAIDTTRDVTQTAVIAIAVVVIVLIITKFTIIKVKKKRYK